MTWTVTLHAWWPALYLGIGAVLWLPMEYLAWRSIARPRPPFWRDFTRLLRRRWWTPLLVVAAWPVALWEELR